jgi:1-deoxy-D-xylulose-5-phosphate synthase
MGAMPSPELDTLPVGKGEIRRHGQQVALLAFGPLLGAALAAGDELNATVANMRFVKPIDIDLIVELAGNHSLLVTLEENAVIGGAGSEVERVLAENGLNVPVLRLGLPDRFIDHGEQGQLLAELGLDKEGIVRAVRALADKQERKNSE